jgi:hypothetical protein
VAQIIPENDKLEVAMGTTPKGAELYIVPTKTGLYKIEYRGAGSPPAFTEQLFTSLLLAKRAVEQYRIHSAAEYAKQAVKQKVINSPTLKEQRAAAALELSNGEVSVPEDDDEV